MITSYTNGDLVHITENSFKTIENASKSVLVFPSASFVKLCKSLIGMEGIVTRRFLPGYEINVTFSNGQILQMKDNWVEKTP